MKRHFPDKPLGKPIRAFEETFSAQTVLLDAFFKPQINLPDDFAILPDKVEGGLEIKTSYERVLEAEKKVK
ncbi:MAG: hypothetical protein JWR80_9999 [Bradyrhizobium sp.]|nr:hypothetical protein [Bradyrhizobium sp.]